MSDQPVKSRRAAREAAFQAAYQCLVGRSSIDRAIAQALERTPFAPDAEDLLRTLANGMVSETAVLEQKFSKYLKEGWTLERIAVSDRLVLRLATYELFDMPDQPPKVTIAEAVKIAKKFGTADSGRFVNGVLAKVLLDSPKKDWPPSEPPNTPTPEPDQPEPSPHP